MNKADGKQSSKSLTVTNKFIANGCSLSGMSGGELFFMLLSGCFKVSGSAERAAEVLKKESGTVREMLTAPFAMLAKTGLFKPAELLRLRTITAAFIYIQKEKLGKSIRADDEPTIERYLRLLYMNSGEETIYLFPIIKNRLSNPIKVASGVETSVESEPSRIITLLKQFPGCSEYIISHNHPDDISAPSETDAVSTGRLYSFSAMEGYTLKQHYIVGTDGVSTVPFDKNILRFIFGVNQ